MVGRGRIGVCLASLIAYLRTTLRVPLVAIQQYLQSMHQLTLSRGGIQAILDVHQALQAEVAALKQQASPILYGGNVPCA